MGISRFNGEGYFDPVPHEAVRQAEKKPWRPIVYICSPYSGDVEGNTEKARRFSRFAVDRGAIPITPHLLYPQFMSEEKERELAMFFNKVLIGKSEELWVFGENVTEGMSTEIGTAKKRGIVIRYFTERLEEK